ncbi:MAG: hypothetical protein LBJ31_07795 [Treponema sp.]|nr:hypothetical protein [Treponema sp.]
MEIKKDFAIYYKHWMSQPQIIPTNITMEEERREMLKLPFKSNYLSLEKYKERINPYKNMNLKKVDE